MFFKVVRTKTTGQRVNFSSDLQQSNPNAANRGLNPRRVSHGNTLQLRGGNMSQKVRKLHIKAVIIKTHLYNNIVKSEIHHHTLLPSWRVKR